MLKEKSTFSDLSDYTFSETWAQEGLITSLDHLIEIGKKGGHEAYILEGLLSVTGMYLDQHAPDENTDLYIEIYNKFNFLRDYILKTAFKSKLKTFNHSMAVGQFVEILILNGLPRIAAIEGTAEWLDMGKSTVRTHNENFRKIYSEQPARGLKLLAYLRTMFEKIDEFDSFPTKHPKSKAAIKKAKDYYIERTDVDRIFKEELKKIGQIHSA